jgi:hypothetical protein
MKEIIEIVEKSEKLCEEMELLKFQDIQETAQSLKFKGFVEYYKYHPLKKEAYQLLFVNNGDLDYTISLLRSLSKNILDYESRKKYIPIIVSILLLDRKFFKSDIRYFVSHSCSYVSLIELEFCLKMINDYEYKINYEIEFLIKYLEYRAYFIDPSGMYQSKFETRRKRLLSFIEKKIKSSEYGFKFPYETHQSKLNNNILLKLPYISKSYKFKDYDIIVAESKSDFIRIGSELISCTACRFNFDASELRLVIEKDGELLGTIQVRFYTVNGLIVFDGVYGFGYKNKELKGDIKKREAYSKKTIKKIMLLMGFKQRMKYKYHDHGSFDL